MNFYTGQHKFYCGIDLHARKMYLCVLDEKGEIRTKISIRTGKHFSKP
jgi:predicted NBD/HSP70 family sugar kinase